MSDLVTNTYDRVSCHTVHLLMHQSLCNPLGPKNGGDINFSLSKAWVYAQYCWDTLMTKVLAKAPLICIFPWPFWALTQIPATPWHYQDSAEVKNTVHSYAWLCSHYTQPKGDRVSNDLFGLVGPWARIILYQLVQLQTNEFRKPVRSFAGMGRITTMDYRNGPKSVPLGTFYIF